MEIQVKDKDAQAVREKQELKKLEVMANKSKYDLWKEFQWGGRLVGVLCCVVVR